MGKERASQKGIDEAPFQARRLASPARKYILVDESRARLQNEICLVATRRF